MSNNSWIEVTRNNPCSRCEKGDWCSRSIDGKSEVCRRVNDGSGLTKTDKSGGEYHIYTMGERIPKQFRMAQSRPLKVPKLIKEENPIEEVGSENLHRVYSTLLSLFPLCENHFKALEQRGFSGDEIKKRGYATLPLHNRNITIQILLKTFDLEFLKKIPGLYFSGNILKLLGAPGILIPIRNSQGQITALKVRADECKNFSKYTWISSKKRNGKGPGAPLHFAKHETGIEKIRITEGELKADISCYLGKISTISLPGVTIWKKLIPALKELKTKTVILAIDMDAFINRVVAKSLYEMATALKEAGFEIEIETWDKNKAKGIDDALIMGIEISSHKGVQTFQTIKKILESAIEANPTLEEIKLIKARHLLSEARNTMDTDQSVIFQSDVLRALILVRSDDPTEYTKFRNKIIKMKVPLRILDQALNREMGAQFLESSRKIDELENEDEISDSEVPAAQERIPYKKYEVKNNCIHWNKSTKDGIKSILLSNFSAVINIDETIDDGIEEIKTFVISGNLFDGKILPTIRVLADEFSSAAWVSICWGARAIISAGMGNRDHLRAAIQELSGKIVSKISYGHTGWRVINKKWYFFFNGGAISTEGFVEEFNVDLGKGKLRDYCLPSPPSGQSLCDAVRASLMILDLAPAKVTYPLFSAIYRAPLGEMLPIDFGMFLFGVTGIGKSEIAGLMQVHFGMGFHSKNLPANWTSTANALEFQASAVKDSLLTIDDFSPQPSEIENKRLQQSAERLFRAQGNQSGRGRLNSEIKERPERFPRGLIMATGEDIPRGVSLRARMFIIELMKTDLDFSKLTLLQEYAKLGLLTQSMSGFIQWLAVRVDSLKEALPKRYRELRQKFVSQNSHKRSQDIVSSLNIGLELFLEFAKDVGAISEVEKVHHINEFIKASVETHENQGRYQSNEDPVNRFIELLATSVASGRTHFCDAKTNSAPENADRWGWRIAGAVWTQANPGPKDTYIPNGDCIGWISGNELWLEPGSAYAAIQKIATDQKTVIPVTESTLWKMLRERQLILVPQKEQRNTMKRMVKGNRRSVIVFPQKEIIWEGIVPVASFSSEDNKVDV